MKLVVILFALFSGYVASASPLTNAIVQVIHIVEDRFPATPRTTMPGTDLTLKYRVNAEDLGQMLGDSFALDQEYLATNIHRCAVYSPSCIAQVILSLKK